MKIEIISIVFAAIALITALILPKFDTKSKNKIWISLAIVLFLTSFIPLILAFIEKHKISEQDEKKRYASIIDDKMILAQLHDLALNNTFAGTHISPTREKLGQNAVIRFIKIYSPAGRLGIYKVVDPSEYGFQSITAMEPVRYHDSVFYIACIAISDKELSKSNKINVITKYANGLMDFERLRIDKLVFNLNEFHNFFPLLLTNKEKFSLVLKAANLADFPSVTDFDEDVGYVIFGNYYSKVNSFSARVDLDSKGIFNVSIHYADKPKSEKFIAEMLRIENLSPQEALKEIASEKLEAKKY